MNRELITKENILRELSNRGYDVKATVITKNGVDMEAIKFKKSSNTDAICYIKDVLDSAKGNESFDDLIEKIIRTLEFSKCPPIDTDLLKDSTFVTNNICIGLKNSRAKNSTEPVSKPLEGFEGIDSYLYIKYEGNENESYRIIATKEVLEAANLPQDKAWEAATNNTINDTKLINIVDLLALNKTPFPDTLPLYILTNTAMSYGAGALVNKMVLVGLCQKYHTKKIAVLPSSVHEVLLMPTDDDTSTDVLTEMVTLINHGEVRPVDRLIDKAFVIDISKLLFVNKEA